MCPARPVLNFLRSLRCVRLPQAELGAVLLEQLWGALFGRHRRSAAGGGRNGRHCSGIFPWTKLSWRDESNINILIYSWLMLITRETPDLRVIQLPHFYACAAGHQVRPGAGLAQLRALQREPCRAMFVFITNAVTSFGYCHLSRKDLANCEMGPDAKKIRQCQNDIMFDAPYVHATVPAAIQAVPASC